MVHSTHRIEMGWWGNVLVKSRDMNIGWDIILRDIVSKRNLRDMHRRGHHMLFNRRNMNGRNVHWGNVHGRNVHGGNVHWNSLMHREDCFNMASWSCNETLCIVSELSLLIVVVAASTYNQNDSNRYNGFHIFGKFIFDKFCDNTSLYS